MRKLKQWLYPEAQPSTKAPLPSLPPPLYFKNPCFQRKRRVEARVQEVSKLCSPVCPLQDTMSCAGRPCSHTFLRLLFLWLLPLPPPLLPPHLELALEDYLMRVSPLFKFRGVGADERRVLGTSVPSKMAALLLLHFTLYPLPTVTKGKEIKACSPLLAEWPWLPSHLTSSINGM